MAVKNRQAVQTTVGVEAEPTATPRQLRDVPAWQAAFERLHALHARQQALQAQLAGLERAGSDREAMARAYLEHGDRREAERIQVERQHVRGELATLPRVIELQAAELDRQRSAAARLISQAAEAEYRAVIARVGDAAARLRDALEDYARFLRSSDAPWREPIQLLPLHYPGGVVDDMVGVLDAWLKDAHRAGYVQAAPEGVLPWGAYPPPGTASESFGLTG